MKNLLSALVVLGITFTSCTITKRKYLPGYSVDFKKNLHTDGSQNKNEAVVFENKGSEKDSVMSKQVSNDELVGSSSKVMMDSIKNTPEICDTIILDDGKVIIGKIKYASNKVNYRKCGDINGMYKSKSIQIVSKIKYGDGRVQEYRKQTDGTGKKKKTYIKGLLGLLLLVPGVIVFVIGIIQASLESSLAVLLPSIVGLFVLGLLAIIIGIRSMNKVNKNRNTYYFESIFFGVLSVLAGLLLVALGFAILFF